MSPIADMVAEMLARGVAADIIVLAVKAAEQASTVRNSTGIPVDESAERRRAYDRERKRIAAEIRRNSTENPQNSKTPLTLTSSPPNTEVQKEVKKVRVRKPPEFPLPPDFQPKQSHFDAADKHGWPRQFVFDKAEDMRIWAGSSGALKADWDLTLHGFMRRDGAKLSATGIHHAKSGIIDAADRALANIEQAEREAAERGAGIGGQEAFRLISQG